MTSSFFLRNGTRTAVSVGLGIAALIITLAPIPKLNTTMPNKVMPLASPTLPANGSPPNLAELTARPLFMATRRPVTMVVPSVVATAPVKPLPSTDGMVLLGILHAGNKAVALVTLPGSSEPKEITIGTELGDWVVTGIMTDCLDLRSGSFKTELMLPLSALPSANPGSSSSSSRPFSPFPSVP